MELLNQDNNHHQPCSPYKVEDGVWMIPCKLDDVKHKFYPLYKPVAPASHLRHPWSQQEDDMLLSLFPTKSSKKWAQIAKELNEKIYNNKPVRNGKQCRERWCNHLNPALKKGGWSYEEDDLIIQKQKEFGNKWSLIAKCLPGRTENSVKNRWKSIIRRVKKGNSGMFDYTGLCRNSPSDQNTQDDDCLFNNDGFCFKPIEEASSCESLTGLDEMDPIEEVCLP
mmetsp:Transcript_5199/g.5168  ORF Transcript_5199/g.5168 Transcript_5199/m.5168 type:complete len:224 (+) Transcript_5199:53-724(+)